jgi:hypothetical protein
VSSTSVRNLHPKKARSPRFNPRDLFPFWRRVCAYKNPSHSSLFPLTKVDLRAARLHEFTHHNPPLPPSSDHSDEYTPQLSLPSSIFSSHRSCASPWCFGVTACATERHRCPSPDLAIHKI